MAPLYPHSRLKHMGGSKEKKRSVPFMVSDSLFLRTEMFECV